MGPAHYPFAQAKPAPSAERRARIHPFRDGNGRVIRLFSDTLIRQLGIDGGGLWSVSRGLMIRRSEYYQRLANADQERQSTSSADGRGHLSERGLREFCEFMLKTMLDQIRFMSGCVELETLGNRIERYLKVDADFGKDTARIFALLQQALFRGQFNRSETERITGTRGRTARLLLSRAIRAGLPKSKTSRAPVELALPAKVLGSYFPKLFPLGQEAIDPITEALG
jgi:Fic family protein